MTARICLRFWKVFCNTSRVVCPFYFESTSILYSIFVFSYSVVNVRFSFISVTKLSFCLRNFRSKKKLFFFFPETLFISPSEFKLINLSRLPLARILSSSFHFGAFRIVLADCFLLIFARVLFNHFALSQHSNT